MFRWVLSLAVICLWTQGARAAEEEASHRTGCGRDLLLLEFTTSEPASVVKMRFNDVSIMYSHKVYGLGHYFFVVENDQSQALEDLTLPADAIQTASVVPVESSSIHLKRLGIHSGAERLDHLPGVNLTLVELTWLAQGLNEAQYRGSMQEMIREVSGGPRMDPSVLLMPVGELPTRFLWYMGQDNCASADFILKHSDPFGGPGGFRTRVLKLHSI